MTVDLKWLGRESFDSDQNFSDIFLIKRYNTSNHSAVIQTKQRRKIAQLYTNTYPLRKNIVKA